MERLIVVMSTPDGAAYRGRKTVNGTQVLVPDKAKAGQSKYLRARLRVHFRRRAAIESLIGHLKGQYPWRAASSKALWVTSESTAGGGVELAQVAASGRAFWLQILRLVCSHGTPFGLRQSTKWFFRSD